MRETEKFMLNMQDFPMMFTAQMSKYKSPAPLP